eukprot:TRINITY_DN2197_c0_g1_i1.p1 TRINITY_DN2197_c0_g1~~TRINITY_DN2197_c0_g1_i1.p1  ORF type:complete len:162 (-),score=34.71 TRINITY_DN2197_c0_g1_i1:254-739(-)
MHELESMRSRVRALEYELIKYRTASALGDDQFAEPQQLQAPVAVMQSWPPVLAANNTTLASDEDPTGPEDDEMMTRVSGRVSGMNISFGGLDSLSGEEMRISMNAEALAADIQRVSKEAGDNGNDAPDLLADCQKLELPPKDISRSTEELLAAFVSAEDEL